MAAEKAFQEVIYFIVESRLNYSIYQTPFSAQLSLKKTFVKHYNENKVVIKVKNENVIDLKPSQFEKLLAQNNQEIMYLHEVIKESNDANDILRNNCEGMENVLEIKRKKFKKENQRNRRQEVQTNGLEDTADEITEDIVIPEVTTSNRFSTLQNTCKETKNDFDELNDPKEYQKRDSSNQTDALKGEDCSKPPNNQPCEFCDEECNQISDVRKHIREKHLLDKGSQVSKTSSLPNLATTNFEEHLCFYCGKLLKSNNELDTHSAASHEHFLSDYYCNKCGKKCKDKADLGFHKFSQHGPFDYKPSSNM